MIRRSMMGVLLISGLATATRTGQPLELLGILTQVAGAVQLAGPGVKGDPLASPWQVVRAGVTLRVPERGNVGIVCSNSRFVRVQGPAAWSLTEQACAAGQELTPAEYALVAPQAGRFKVVNGLMLLESEMRGTDGDDPLAPLTLSPRSAVRSPRPTVSWLRVPSATEYRVELRGRGIHYDTLLKGGDIACVASPERIEICSRPWPADFPDLPPGETFFLGIASHEGIAEPWHRSELVEVRTLAITDAGRLEDRLRRLDRLGFEGAALQSAHAGLLAEAGLYTDAADAYRAALAATPSPELLVTLADVYLVSGLHRLAELRYREALSNAPPSVRAAASFGLGRVEYARGGYREAAIFFQQARKLYAGLKLEGEEEAARLAEDRFR